MEESLRKKEKLKTGEREREEEGRKLISFSVAEFLN